MLVIDPFVHKQDSLNLPSCKNGKLKKNIVVFQFSKTVCSVNFILTSDGEQSSCKMVFIMNQPGLFSPIAIHIHKRDNFSQNQN
jgi:hypothetical protein